MTQGTRYQIRELYAEYGNVRSYRGIDPLTGLLVLIYRFPGRPASGASDINSENIPGILEASFDEGQGQLVVAYSQEYRQLSAPVDPSEVLAVLKGSARALYDAATAGVIHGDIRPERFLSSDSHLLLEGFGVNWGNDKSEFSAPERAAGPSYAADVYAWAKSVIHLCGENIPGELNEILAACLDLKPEDRPEASALYQQIAALSAAAATIPTETKDVYSSAETLKTSDTLNLEIDFSLSEAFSPPATSQTQPEPVPPTPEEKQEDPEPLLLHSDPGLKPVAPPERKSPAPKTERLLKPKSEAPKQEQKPDSGPGFVKDLPPGAKYKAGSNEPVNPSHSALRAPIIIEEDSKKRDNRRGFLLFSLVAAAIMLASLAFFRQDLTVFSGPQSANRVQYIVNVNIEPESLRYVSLLVVKSPSGSARRPNDIIANVPGPAVLDQAGEWQLRARFQDNISEAVTVRVPEEQAITLVLPEPEPETTPR